MNCEIIAVGTELLLGEIANTDAQVISQGLAELGINVFFHSVCGDNPQRLQSVLAIAKSRADIIITTGGLGPTADDLTKETIAAAFGKQLELHQPSLDRMIAQFAGRVMTKNNEKQALIPQGATVFDNDWGTAPGCAFTAEGCTIIMLPGPPRECTNLFRHRVMPYLEKMKGGALCSRFIKVFGMGESAMEDLLAPQMNSWKNPTAAPYAKEGECLVRVTAFAPTKEEARALTEPAVAELQGILGDVAYGVDVDSLEQVVVSGLLERGMTIATAESCTGGLIGKRLTDISGASACFLGGVTAYSNEVKMKLLGVSGKTLAEHGAVSPQVACEMAQGVRDATGAQIGIATTGVAGPGGGTEEKPVGLIYLGLSTPQGTQALKLLRTGWSRDRLRAWAASSALDWIRREVL